MANLSAPWPVLFLPWLREQGVLLDGPIVPGCCFYRGVASSSSGMKDFEGTKSCSNLRLATQTARQLLISKVVFFFKKHRGSTALCSTQSSFKQRTIISASGGIIYEGQTENKDLPWKQVFVQRQESLQIQEEIFFSIFSSAARSESKQTLNPPGSPLILLAGRLPTAKTSELQSNHPCWGRSLAYLTPAQRSEGPAATAPAWPPN